MSRIEREVLQVQEKTKLLEYYRQRGLLRSISGEGPVEKIRQSLRDVSGATR